MKLALAAVLLAVLVVIEARATHGFDLSYYQGDVSQSSFDCLKNDGMQFAIFQAQRSNGKYNSYLKHQYDRSVAAGIKYNDHYVFPDTNKDAKSQIKSTIASMKADGVLSKNMIWVDIENTDYWYSSHSQNIQFLKDFITEAKSQWSGCGNRHGCIGIYTSSSQWSAITGGTTDSFFANLQLWYCHYDNNASFSDFKAFGPWSKPAMKQYTGTTSKCSTQIDNDCY
ncbi:glycoside hydrolase, family 25 [Kipferlia bialata]|uniref:Glycoside hydrolase, family 25 n=1 Tax=Kipferlia bialata TaxID=797122 RepID=A0A9K3CQS9_9EUKA|nr:glycoside hydrolase, family 25 [Kipferlia bialata]|eukprot:g1495.t1